MVILCYETIETLYQKTMVSERLNGIEPMHDHHKTVLDIEKVIDLFSTKKKT